MLEKTKKNPSFAFIFLAYDILFFTEVLIILCTFGNVTFPPVFENTKNLKKIFSENSIYSSFFNLLF